MRPHNSAFAFVCLILAAFAVGWFLLIIGPAWGEGGGRDGGRDGGGFNVGGGGGCNGCPKANPPQYIGPRQDKGGGGNDSDGPSPSESHDGTGYHDDPR